MPKLAEYPVALQPFIHNGLDIDIRGDEAIGDCPFCGREGKFSVETERGVWKCWSCTEGSDKGGGNIYTFISLLYEMGKKKDKNHTLLKQYAKEKNIINLDTLYKWGVFIHPITDELALAGFNKEGSVTNIYRYLEDHETEKMRWMVTKGLHHTLLGISLFNKNKKNIFLCEGLHDAMCLYETLGFIKSEVDEKEDSLELSFTSSEEESILQDYNILAVPSASIFQERWVEIFSRKKVILLPHNDHPRKNKETGKIYESVGYSGMRRVSQEICSCDSPPESVEYLSWNPTGEDHNPLLESGYDIRDLLTESPSGDNTYDERIDGYVSLLSLIREVPASWTKSEKKNTQLQGMDSLPCEDWNTLVNAWRKALKWTEGLDRALSVMLACVASTNSKGDQLWIKIISPPGTGKTSLCRGLAVSKKYVLEASIITGLHSGWKGKSEDGEPQDFSLITKMRNKTLVMKDADTLLKTPNLNQILSQFRDLYDGETSSHYRSQDTKEEKGHRGTIILFGTDSLRQLDASELGERFIDCIIMKGIDVDLEEEILWRTVNTAIKNSKEMVNGKLEGHYNEEMGKALRLTGGYVGYLRRNAEELVNEVEVFDEVKRELMDLARFVAYMRARPSKTQDEKQSRELATRLVSQLPRLALYLSATLNKNEVDEEVMRRVRQCALDTAEGKTLEIAKVLYKSGSKGEETNKIAYQANYDLKKIITHLAFLRSIEAVEPFYPMYHGVRGEVRWRLKSNVYKLYERAVKV